MGLAPLDVEVTIHVPDPQAEKVCIYIEADYSTSTCWPFLFKDTVIPIRDLPEGEYQVWATFTSKDQIKVSPTVEVSVR